MSTDCFLCLSSLPTPQYFTTIINEALYDRYATSYNQRYLDSIDDLIEVQYTEEAAIFREYCYFDDDEDHLSRFYRLEEWGRKIKNLGTYWSYHIDVPRFFGLPIELAFYKYYDKIRQFQEKEFRIKMGEYVESFSSVRDDTGEISVNANKNDMNNILKDLSCRMQLDQSRAFNDICGKLNDLVKVKGKRIKKMAILPYFKDDTDRDNFSVFVKNQSKVSKRRRLPRKNMVSDEVLPVYAFRKTHNKTKNLSKQLLHKGSMESTMSKKNICNINIQIQNAVFCGENKGPQPFKPLLKDIQSLNRLRFKSIDKKPSIGQIYGTINSNHPKPGIMNNNISNNTNTNNNNTLFKPSLVDFKKRVGNRSQSVLKPATERTHSVNNLKVRSNSINTIKYVPAQQRKSIPDPKKPSPSKSKQDFSVTLNNGLFKRRPTPGSTSRGKIGTQTSLKKFAPLESTQQAKSKVQRMLKQKLFVNVNPSSLYEKLKRAPR